MNKSMSIDIYIFTHFDGGNIVVNAHSSFCLVPRLLLIVCAKGRGLRAKMARQRHFSPATLVLLCAGGGLAAFSMVALRSPSAVRNDLLVKSLQDSQKSLLNESPGRKQLLHQHLSDQHLFTHVSPLGSIGHTTTVQEALSAASKDVGMYMHANVLPQQLGRQRRNGQGRKFSAHTQMLWNAQKSKPYNPMELHRDKVTSQIMEWQTQADKEPDGTYLLDPPKY